MKTSKIENKYSNRSVQKYVNLMHNYRFSADIELNDVFVAQNNRLENALDFASGANNILKHSRLFVAWIATGSAAGAIESAIKYTLSRKQFGKEIASFQII